MIPKINSELEYLINDSLNKTKQQYQFLKKEKRRIRYSKLSDRFSRINFKKTLKYSVACIATFGIIAGYYLTKTNEDYVPKFKEYYTTIVDKVRERNSYTKHF